MCVCGNLVRYHTKDRDEAYKGEILRDGWGGYTLLLNSWTWQRSQRILDDSSYFPESVILPCDHVNHNDRRDLKFKGKKVPCSSHAGLGHEAYLNAVDLPAKLLHVPSCRLLSCGFSCHHCSSLVTSFVFLCPVLH